MARGLGAGRISRVQPSGRIPSDPSRPLDATTDGGRKNQSGEASRRADRRAFIDDEQMSEQRPPASEVGARASDNSCRP